MEEADYEEHPFDTSIFSTSLHCIPADSDDVEDLIFESDEPEHQQPATSEPRRLSLTSLQNPLLDSLLQLPVQTSSQHNVVTKQGEHRFNEPLVSEVLVKTDHSLGQVVVKDVTDMKGQQTLVDKQDELQAPSTSVDESILQDEVIVELTQDVKPQNMLGDKQFPETRDLALNQTTIETDLHPSNSERQPSQTDRIECIPGNIIDDNASTSINSGGQSQLSQLCVNESDLKDVSTDTSTFTPNISVGSSIPEENDSNSNDGDDSSDESDLNHDLSEDPSSESESEEVPTAVDETGFTLSSQNIEAVDSTKPSLPKDSTKGKSPKVKKEKSPRGQKRKSKGTLHRKNIKKVLTDEYLSPEVVAARKEEEERIQRQNQAYNDFMRKQDEERKKQREIIQQNIIDEIVLSSDDDESDVKAAREELIDLCDEDQDNTVQSSEDVDDDQLDMNNCGLFTDDKYNCPDSEGRVLVNVGHADDEEDIFLAPQLARAVKPHQIGGIRFMYANVVESRKKFDTSRGVGCILAHSMGLGKTLQVIAFTDIFLSTTSAKKVLIIVPINTLQNWVAEFDHWIPKQPSVAESWSGDHKDVQYRRFKVFVMHDCKTLLSRSKEILLWKKEGGVLLMGYEMYRIIVLDSTKNMKNLDLDDKHTEALLKKMKEALVDPGPDLVVCDEGHRIKNSASFAAQALKNIKTKRRIVLTGYPIQNNLMEYWCMIDFVRPNHLGSDKDFANMFDKPIRNGQCIDSNLSDQKMMRERSHVLFKLLSGFVQRRSHSILKDCLPPKFEYVFMTKMTPLQKELMLTFIKYLMNRPKNSNMPPLNPIVMYSVCTKIWNHPDILYRIVMEESLSDVDEDFDVEATSTSKKKKTKKADMTSSSSFTSSPSTSFAANLRTLPKERLLDYSWAKPIFENYVPNILEKSVKMQLLFEMIDKIISRGDRLLVFSQSLLTLNLIEQFLSERTVFGTDEKWIKMLNYYRLDGSTTSHDRERFINHFNRDDSLKLFLLSTRAGSLGINLIGANRIIIFDVSWNPCHDAQAACRIYRYGQKKDCYIYRLVCDQSLEKKIYDRQVSKQGMSNRVVDELNPENRFVNSELTSLISGLTTIEYSAYLDISDKFVSECLDPVTVDTCLAHKELITQEPFEHESLLLDDKLSKLSKMEKANAFRNFEMEKRRNALGSNGYHHSNPFPSHHGNYNHPNFSSGYPPTNGTPLLTTPPYNPYIANSTMTNPNGSFITNSYGSQNGFTHNTQIANNVQGSSSSNNSHWNGSTYSQNVSPYPIVDAAQRLKLEETKNSLTIRGFVAEKTIVLRADINLVDKTNQQPTVVPRGSTVFLFRNTHDQSQVLLTPDSKIVDIKHAMTGSVLPSTSQQSSILRVSLL